MKKSKNLCDWDRKEIEKKLADIVPLVSNPKYICHKCARVANQEGLLCKAIKIKKLMNRTRS